MTTDKNNSIDITGLAKRIAQDINQLDKVAAETGRPKDLKNIDFPKFLPVATTEILKGTLTQLQAKANEASKRHELQVQEVSDEIESSMNIRQEKLASDLTKLRKTAIKDDAEAKTILAQVKNNVSSSNRRIEEIQIEKTVKIQNISIKRTNTLEIGKKITG